MWSLPLSKPGPSSESCRPRTSQSIRERAVVPSAERVAEVELTTDHDLAAFVDVASEPLGAAGRWLHYGLTSSDVLDTALALQLRDAGALIMAGLNRSLASVVRLAEEHRGTICIGRSHGIHAEPTTFGWKLAGWAFELDRGADAARACARGLPGRPVLRHSRCVRWDRSRGRANRVRAPRSRARLGFHPGHLPRPARRAPGRPRRLRVVARSFCDRDPPPGPHRGARGRGAFRGREQGLVGDAAQAKPEDRRAHLGPRPCRTGRGDCRLRERPAVARARHLAFVGRARRHSRRVPGARLHARPVPPARRRSRRLPGADGAEPLGLARPVLLPSAAARADRERRRAQRGLPARPGRGDARVGRGARLPRARRADSPRSRHTSTRPRSTTSSTSPRPSRTSTPCSTGCIGSSQRRNAHRSMSDAAVTLGSGKVREIYALDDDRLLLVASDRISTFDVVLPTEIPDKGRVLTGLSGFWFAQTEHVVPNHLLALREDGRSTECRRLEMLPIECVVRGYLVRLRLEGLPRDRRSVRPSAPRPACVESERLPEPIFTPGTKAETGHDENIDREAAVGARRRRALRRGRSGRRSSSTRFASEHALERGIILADTKLEFGIDPDGRARPRRRGLHAGLVALLARRRVPARPAPAVVRQAVRPRLLRVARLGQDLSRPRAAGRRRRRARAPATSRRSRSSPGSASTTTSTTRRSSSDEGDRARPPKPGILDPQGQAVGHVAARPRVRRRRDPRRSPDRRRSRDRRRRDGPRTARSDVRAAADQPADRELRDRAATAQ